MRHPNPRHDGVGRRKWLSMGLAGLGSVGGAIIGLPAGIAALSPLWRKGRGPAWRRAGPVDGFVLGAVVPVEIAVGRGDWARSLDSKTVYVWRRSEADFVVYSRNCTDLSCPLVFDAGSECFFCPCHGAIFGKHGRPMAGPPARPLYRYATRIREQVLEVDIRSLPPMT